jgi:polyisoprenoid-binding protein YceI
LPQIQVFVPNWTVDKATSSLSFSGSMTGDVFSGTFAGFDAAILLDPNDLDEARITVSVNMIGADAGDAERTDTLPGKEWFAVKEFPISVFESGTINRISDNRYEAIGTLTIKDVTRALTLPFSLEITGDTAKATAQISINRTDFGVGTGMWKGEDIVDHDVGISIVINASRPE